MIKRACYTDPGRQGKQNQDAVALPAPGVDESRFGTLLAIADGTGGLPEGGEASQEAVHYLQTLYYAAPQPLNLPERLRQSVEQVNALNRLARRQRIPEKGHLTTLVAAVIYSDQIWVANVGDSRAYLVEADGRNLVQLTEDHSEHIQNVKVGLADETDATSRESGVITRAIGLQDDCQVDIYHYTWSLGDRLLLCSDGLSHLMPEEMVSTILDYPPAKAAHDLVKLAVVTDGSDNCTAVVAAWLPSDPSGFEKEQDGSASHAALKINPPPTASTGTDRRIHINLPRWLQLQPDTRLLLLGVLLGWLSAGLLALLLVLTGP